MHQHIKHNVTTLLSIYNHISQYFSGLTWCILHGYHEGLVFQEVLIVLYDVWVVEEFQDLALVLSGQTLISRHLLHWDFLQDDEGPIVTPSAQMNNADGGEMMRN